MLSYAVFGYLSSLKKIDSFRIGHTIPKESTKVRCAPVFMGDSFHGTSIDTEIFHGISTDIETANASSI